MPDASFPELMAELARVADIADLAIEDDRYACLSIDETFTLHLRFDESTNEVYLFSNLGGIPEAAEAALCRRFLEANYLWQETGGGTISVYWPEREAVLAPRQSLELLDPARFCEWVQRFLDNATTWRSELATDQSAPPSESPESATEGFDAGALRI